MALGTNKFGSFLNSNIESEDKSFTSRLHKGSEAFGTLGVMGTGSAVNQNATKEGETSVLLQLNEVTPRFANKYIQDAKTLNALCTSIRNQGLIQPIKVVGIDSMIEISDGEEKSHYEAKKESGYKYVIIAGHRRYEAFVSNFLDNNDPSWKESGMSSIEYYENKAQVVITKAVDCISRYNKSKSGIEFIGITDELQKEYDNLKHFFIPSFVSMNVSEEDETRIYNDTNLTQRAVSSFEVVANVWDEISVKDKKELEEFVKENCKGDGRVSINKALSNYISNTYGLDVSTDNISRILRIIEIFDPRLLKSIYNGKLTFKDAKELNTVYKKLSKEYPEKLEEFIVKCEDGNYSVSELKSLIKLGKEKREKVKKNEIEKNEVLKLLRRVKNGKMTIEELIEDIKNNY